MQLIVTYGTEIFPASSLKQRREIHQISKHFITICFHFRKSSIYYFTGNKTSRLCSKAVWEQMGIDLHWSILVEIIGAKSSIFLWPRKHYVAYWAGSSWSNPSNTTHNFCYIPMAWQLHVWEMAIVKWIYYLLLRKCN